VDAARIEGPHPGARTGAGPRWPWSVARFGGGLPASALLIGSIISIQCGSALATSLFSRCGVAGTAFLRCTFAALVLLAMTRPRLRGRARVDLAWLVVFGLLLAGMNVTFYEAIDRLPLGIVVTVEFLGPLTVATVFSRRRRDLIWIALAAAGVAAFAGLPGGGALDTTGLAFAFAAGACWGSYVLVAKRVGRSWQGSEGLAVSMAVTAVVLAPLGIASGGVRLVDPGLLLLAALVGVFSGAIPFALELAALRRLTATSYGVLTSLEPAVAGAVGLVLLGQRPRTTEIVAAALVVIASIGATRSATVPPGPARDRSPFGGRAPGEGDDTN
jgi:inner membrane transporter RhtA